MICSFHPEAEREFRAAIEHYESCEPGLGQEFAAEVASTIRQVLAFPKAWPQIDPGIRRSLVRRFPYGVLFEELSGRVHILAIMHLHRDPDYWKDRI